MEDGGFLKTPFGSSGGTLAMAKAAWKKSKMDRYFLNK